MKPILIYIILTICLAVGSINLSLAQTPEQLYQKGLGKEEGEGALQDAINFYDQIANNSNADKSLQAKALLHIGMCYEKLGNKEAVKAYQRLVNTCPDQTELVALAKGRLAALGGSGGSRGLVTRRILTDASGIGEVLTADGKYIIGIDWETSDVIKFEVASGNISRITNIGGIGAKILYSQYRQQVFSRDGKQIAYDSRTGWDNGMIPQLLIRNLDGSGLRTLYSGKSDKDSYILPLDWSFDAASILALRRNLDKPNEEVKELTMISTADGSVRVLRTITADYPLMTRARLSPDGKYIAYSAFGESKPLNGDIYLMTSDGRNGVVIAGHPSEDQLLAWAPDGKSILFLSDRSGTWDIWTICIAGGKPQGEPELLKHDFGLDSKVLGLTPDGSLYYMTYSSLGGLYSGEIDLETGKLLIKPEPIKTRYSSTPSGPAWSPDGKNLLYVSRKSYFAQRTQLLTIRSVSSGEERFLSPPLGAFGWPSWAPDGRSVITVGFSREDGGVFRIDTETNVATKLVDVGLAPKLCPDGKTLVYVMDGGQIMKKRNLETKEESEVVKTGHMFFDLSPDGREVVFQVNDTVKIISLKGGAPRELFHDLAKGGYDLRWTRDGRYIIAREGSEIWRVPAQGGTPLKLDLSVPKMGDFTLNPDNSRFAFSVNEGTKSELWVLENFLPKEETHNQQK